MLVIGAGMAGLLAAAMLRNECVGIVESQSSLPNNHSAILRFRTSVVGDTLNIPFKKVKVLKAVHASKDDNPIKAMLQYSFKTNGSYTLRSPISVRGEIEERFIAPPDLIQQMADRVMCSMDYDTDFDDVFHDLVAEGHGMDGFISTLPMPVLMRILEWKGEQPQFRSVPGYNISFDVNAWGQNECDAYVTLYVPNPDLPFSRISITGSQVIIEFQCPGKIGLHIDEIAQKDHSESIEDACRMLGNLPRPGSWDTKVQNYSKILPIDEGVRKRFMLWATEEHRVFSLGRYATWRPGLLLDDLVKDVRVISNIAQQGTYEQRR